MRTARTQGFSAIVGAFLAIGLGLTGCAEPRAGRDALTRACDPSFGDADGWLGGDAAFSVPLGAIRPDPETGELASLWLFGDSFVTPPPHDPTRRYPFVHNVVGVSRCRAGDRWQIDYAWRQDDAGRPHAFFSPDPAAAWVRDVVERVGRPPYYWPFAGFVHGRDVFVGLLRVAPSAPNGPFALPFRIVGTDLARLTPTRSPAELWPLEILPFAPVASLVPAAAFVAESDFVYAFAFMNGADGGRPRALTRLPTASLGPGVDDLPDRWETLGRDGTWRPGLDADGAAIVIDADATEMSVFRDPGSASWWAIESGARAASERGAIRLHRARRLEGPWSAAQPILALPPVADLGPGEPLCYAGKAHPQYATPDTILVTYVCSLFTRDPAESLDVLSELARRTDLYRPIAVRLPRPATPQPAPGR